MTDSEGVSTPQAEDHCSPASLYLAVHQLGIHVHGLLGRTQYNIQGGLGTEQPVVQLIRLTAVPLQSLLLLLLLQLVVELLLRDEKEGKLEGGSPER